MDSIRPRPGVVRKTVIWTVALTVVAAATSCSRVVDGTALAAQPKVGAPIEWKECHSDPSDTVQTPAGAQCGKMAVPVDYADPDGDSATLSLIRIPATGSKIGSLIINPGGPGESGVESAKSLVQSMPAEVRKRFDLVGFDPRGVAASNPAVWCNSDAENDKLRSEPLVDYSPEGVAHMEEITKEFVQRCFDKTGEKFLANVGTASVIQDLDLLREGLGDPKLNYLGFSYGTRIGALYAEKYPDKVRAMVLDGAIDPNADPVEADVRQAKAFQTAFDDYAADCAKSPDCPLGTDPKKAVDEYHSLVNPLVEKPAPTNDPRGLSYPDAIVGTILPLYSPSLWRHLTAGLKELKKGRGDKMLMLADLYMGRDSKGHYNNSTDVRVAVNCVDKPAVKDRQTVIETDRRVREAAPFMNYGEFTGNAPLGTCAFWPVPPTTQPHTISAQGLPPIMVISTTNDPATPYQAGVDLAKQLGGTLITYEGTQHTVAFQGNECIDEMVADYFIDPVRMPDARC